ncbi:carbonic anhydrase [Trichophyton equinum CBS 127.97]|uniref:Carbonic anhydrase n=1 Tax=Trichophyton equinum (strain ATCC MYA-4606 / CBS 127.97) TaxID=559882 RepID=F2PNH4_TRIEC|nr:carbonic anhydrase [Trichophyton equinum CBS 127.97]
MAFSDGAIRDYISIEDLLDDADLGLPDDTDIHPIPFNETVSELPLFRPYTEVMAKNSTGKSRGASSFGQQFAEAGHRANFEFNVTTRACRRWALMEADGKYSETARMKFAGQKSRYVFGEKYAHPLCEVDGQAMYLGIVPRVDHIKNGRGMHLRRHQHLLQSLPAKSEMEFHQRKDVVELQEKWHCLHLQMKKADGNAKRELELQQRSIYRQKVRLYNDELKLLRGQQSFKLQRPGIKGTPINVYEETFFHYSRQVMPERDLLAKILPTKIELRSVQGRQALHALEKLCGNNNRIAYRRSFSPVDGRCICGEDLNSFGRHRQWLHLFRCYERRYRDSSTSRFVKLCLNCDLWFTSEEDWREHCTEHLSTPESLPLRCDLLMFRNVPISAGRCPFCLGDSSLCVTKRMTEYIINWKDWNTHVEDHLVELKRSGAEPRCTHPLCNILFDSFQMLIFHLQDIHCCLRRPKNGAGGKRDRAMIESIKPTALVVIPSHGDKPPGRKRARRCINPKPLEAKCPICDANIDARFLQEFTGNKAFVPLKVQKGFCTTHRKKEAELQRIKCGYPIMDWDTVPSRLVYLSPLILDIIESKRISFFENTAAPEKESFHSPGYYGLKGIDIIGEYIAETHFIALRNAAPTKITRWGGVATYIQNVLVLEVLTKFVAEDMGVDDNEARYILERSKGVGEMLNGVN